MKPILKTAYAVLIACGLVVSYGNAAHAQDAGAPEVVAVDANVDAGADTKVTPAAPAAPDTTKGAPPAPPSDDLSVLRKAYDGIVHGDNKWRALAVFLLIGFVFMTRRYGGTPIPVINYPFLPPKLYAWFTTDRGGVVLVFMLASMGALGHALAADIAWSFVLVENAVMIGISAAGAYVMARRLANPPDKKEGGS